MLQCCCGIANVLTLIILLLLLLLVFLLLLSLLLLLLFMFHEEWVGMSQFPLGVKCYMCICVYEKVCYCNLSIIITKKDKHHVRLLAGVRVHACVCPHPR